MATIKSTYTLATMYILTAFPSLINTLLLVIAAIFWSSLQHCEYNFNQTIISSRQQCPHNAAQNQGGVWEREVIIISSCTMHCRIKLTHAPLNSGYWLLSIMLCMCNSEAAAYVPVWAPGEVEMDDGGCGISDEGDFEIRTGERGREREGEKERERRAVSC